MEEEIKSKIIGWYYLHENGSMIYKNYSDAIVDIRESDLCRSAWKWSGERSDAWDIVVEALSIGVDKQRINELATTWKCDDTDALNYAEYIGITLSDDNGIKQAIKDDHIGEGETYLEAMADLCKKIGYRGGKYVNKLTFKLLISKL